MNEPRVTGMERAAESIQQRLTDYACCLNYGSLPPEVIQAAKVRIIDTLGVLIGGFHGQPCRITRSLAARRVSPGGATVIGTRIKTTPDMAALANGTAARYLEMNDIYRFPGSFGGHPSDVVAPLLAAAEHAGSSGRELIAGVVLGYEVFLRMSDVFHNVSFDHTNLGCLATAVAAGKLWRLTRSQIWHCIAMALLHNIILRQVRMDQLSMWKAVATGHAGRAGLFAALLAQAGMEGPPMPFDSTAGWCNHVARERLALGPLGGDHTSFKILETQMRTWPCTGHIVPLVRAAERIAPLGSTRDVQSIRIEVYKRTKDRNGIPGVSWNPDSPEAADHSAPYVVAAVLMDGGLTPHSYNEAHLWNPELRVLLQKIELIENVEFTQAYNQQPKKHQARITVRTHRGETLVAESSRNEDDRGEQSGVGPVEEKFHRLTDETLGRDRAEAILARLWRLDDMVNVAEIPSALVLG